MFSPSHHGCANERTQGQRDQTPNPKGLDLAMTLVTAVDWEARDHMS